MRAEADHRALIRTRWPDKALFANVLLLVAGSLGLIHAFAAGVDGVRFSSRWLAFIETYPPWVTAGLSLLCAACAILSLRTRNLVWGVPGAVAGFFSFGLVLVEPVLATIAAWFLLKARLEGEDTDPGQVRLTARQWPDKTLAASALLLMAGTATLEWWLGILFGVLHADGITPGVGVGIIGGLGLAAGLLCLIASHAMYHQRLAWLGVTAAVAGVLALGLLVVAPLLSMAALVLVLLGWREGEFQSAAASTFRSPPVAAPPVPGRR